MLKVLIVDDEYLVRTGIRETIDWHSYGAEIVGEAENGEEGLELALRLAPDVIVTDVRMPFMNGLELIEKLKEHRLSAGIIVLSGYDEFQYAQAALRHGVSSYLLKPVDTNELAEAVRTIGIATRTRVGEQNELVRLTNEKPAIAAQFWLNLLQGRLSDEAIREKSALLPLLDSGDTLYAAIVLDVRSQTSGSLGSILERLAGQTLETHSLRASAMLELFPGRMCIVVAGEEAWESMLPRIRSFGAEAANALQTGSDAELLVGIGTPSTELSKLHSSAMAAGDAVAKASASFARVWYAEDREEAARREVQGALAYIREHYASNVTVEMAASTVYVSPTHLMHLFRKELNKTFYECLTEYRIEQAKRLLRDPGARVYEVGDKVGFGDAKYFSQVFKKMTGRTPSEYARSGD